MCIPCSFLCDTITNIYHVCHPSQTMEELAASVSLESQKLALEDKSGKNPDKKPAPVTGGCRIEGFVLVKKVIISFHNESYLDHDQIAFFPDTKLAVLNIFFQ